MLALNKGLERLVMTHTAVTDAGAQQICNALQVRSNIRNCVCRRVGGFVA